MANMKLTKEMFRDKEDHDQQLTNALSKFSSMGPAHLEQLLVNEELVIGDIYPNLIGVETKNPFE